MDEFDEYNDPDATSCALGDYNAWEDNQVFLDREDDDDHFDHDFYDEYDRDWSD